MCNNKQRFSKLDENVHGDVYIAAEHSIKSHGVGEIQMDIKLNNRVSNNIKLQNAIYVPNLRNNLVSVSSITEKEYTVTFRKSNATINHPNDSVVATAIRDGQLYMIREIKNQFLQSTQNKHSDLMKWHQRYSHLNLNDLKKLVTNDLVTDMSINQQINDINCEICYKYKIYQLPYKRSSNRAKTVLELVHSDICGPIETESLGGAKYFVTFVDDFSRYTEVAMLKSCSKVLNAFQNYKHRVEKKTGHCIKKLRTDNAQEYKSKEFTDFLQQEGIGRQLSIKYTPQQNGVAERINQTLVKMSRCLLLQASLSKSLWAEITNAAAFIRNRCPSKSLNEKTPFELWKKKTFC